MTRLALAEVTLRYRFRVPCQTVCRLYRRGFWWGPAPQWSCERIRTCSTGNSQPTGWFGTGWFGPCHLPQNKWQIRGYRIFNSLNTAERLWNFWRGRLRGIFRRNRCESFPFIDGIEGDGLCNRRVRRQSAVFWGQEESHEDSKQAESVGKGLPAALGVSNRERGWDFLVFR